MIVCDLFQLSWLISWLTTARHPSSLPIRPCRTTIKGHERAIIRLAPRCHTATYKPTLLHGSLDNPSWRAHALAVVPNFPVRTIKSAFVQPQQANIIMCRLASLWPATFSPNRVMTYSCIAQGSSIYTAIHGYHTLSVVHNQRCEFQITCTIGPLSWLYSLSVIMPIGLFIAEGYALAFITTMTTLPCKLKHNLKN